MIELTPLVSATLAILAHSLSSEAVEPLGPERAATPLPASSAEPFAPAGPAAPVHSAEVPASFTTWSRQVEEVPRFRPHFEGYYIALRGGLVTTDDSDGADDDVDFDEGILAAVAIGHHFANPHDRLAFAVEVEGVWTDQDADDDPPMEAVRDVTTLGPFLNGQVDLRLFDALSIYGGAGIGLAWIDVGTESDFDDEDGPFFSWQALGGARVWLSEWAALSLGYRFRNIDDAEIDEDAGGVGFDLETMQHVLELGLAFGL